MKKFQKITSAILVLVMCVGILACTASAIEPRVSIYFNTKRVTISPNGGGEVEVGFTVATTGTMQLLGAQTIVIYESTDGGSTWDDVATYNGSLRNGLYTEDNNVHSGSITYQGTAGYKYKATVTFYAKGSAGSGVNDKTSSSITAK